MIIKIERVIFDGEGKKLTDGIAVGMSAERICEKLNASGLVYDASNATTVIEKDLDGNDVEACHICFSGADVDYTVVFTEGMLDRVELVNYYGFSLEGKTPDTEYEHLREAVSFVTENGLASFDINELAYEASIYSSYFDSWFFGWRFTKGDYEGCIICVEEDAPNRVYVALDYESQPILFWCDGKYVDPILTFLGKWRAHDNNEYIDIRSISREGIVVFDMCVVTDSYSGNTVLIENLSTAFNSIPDDLDTYIFAEYNYESLTADMQIYDGEIQSGYYIYNNKRYYMIDLLSVVLIGRVEYTPRSVNGGVGSGVLSVHIPSENCDYSQASTWGYMEFFGRDYPNPENYILSNDAAGDQIINNYLNELYQTSGLNYANLEYTYLYDFVFPVNGLSYSLWMSRNSDDPYYMYGDVASSLIIKEYRFNSVSKHSKELVYKLDRPVSAESYTNQIFTTLDGQIKVDFANRTISNKGSFVQSDEFSDLLLFYVGRNERLMFFSEIGNRFTLNGYVLFDHTTWGATLHITDSDVPGFAIGVYYLNSETFVLDPSIEDVRIPEDTENGEYIDGILGEGESETRLVIREFSGKIIGYIYVDDQGVKTVRDHFGKILGYYYPDRDVTTDFYGNIIARGDVASALLFAK